MSLFYNNLGNYYKTNMLLMSEHKYSLTEIENLMPWERTIYIALLNNHMKEKEDQRKARQQ